MVRNFPLFFCSLLFVASPPDITCYLLQCSSMYCLAFKNVFPTNSNSIPFQYMEVEYIGLGTSPQVHAKSLILCVVVVNAIWVRSFELKASHFWTAIRNLQFEDWPSLYLIPELMGEMKLATTLLFSDNFPVNSPSLNSPSAIHHNL